MPLRTGAFPFLPGDIPLVLIGGGGLAREVMSYLIDEGIAVMGYCDIEEKHLDIPWLGPEESLFSPGAYNYLICVGDIATREKIYQSFISPHEVMPLAFHHASAYVSKTARLGYGCIVGPNATVAGNARLGFGNLINFGAGLGHDVKMGSNSIIAPGAQILGGVTMGDNNYIGANAVVLPGSVIGSDCIVSAGQIANDMTDKKMLTLQGGMRSIE